MAARRSFLKTGIILSLILLFSDACGPQTPEQEIQNFLDRMAGLVEDGNKDALLDLLDEGYRDFGDRDKNVARVMVGDYFRRYQGIVAHILANRIDRIEGVEADLRVDIALSSGAAQFFRKMVRFSFDNYRFRFKLIKTGGIWRIQYAEWKWISGEDLFPESRTLLNKILAGK